MTAPRYDVAIVGAGHAGAQAAIALRQGGFAGSIALVGDEPDPPYERPPLSKDYLAGEKPFARLLIRPVDFWAGRGIELLRGRRIVAVDPLGRVVTDESGGRIGYDRLIWATGGEPRRLTCPGHDLPNVHAVRSRADVDRMIAQLPGTGDVAVIGGGYIGLVAAAVLTKLGKRVTVIEAQDRVLARVAGEPLSRFFEAEHRAHGVTLHLNAAVVSIEETDGRATGVRLAEGRVLPADMLIVGIGIVPTVAPLVDAGAAVGNGVTVDPFCRTSLSDIYAIGDCAAHSNPYADGATIRLESVQNANDQATTAVRDILGQPTAYDAVPWFWSNQYDLRLQTVGLSGSHDETVLREDPAARSFSVVYLQEGRVVALDCVNATKDYVQGRALVTGAVQADRTMLADPAIALKTLVAPTAP